VLTRALHGILGFSGPVYDPVRNLAPCEIVPALRAIRDNFVTATQASVSYEWSYWYGRTHILGEDMKDFTDGVKKLANELNCHGHALTITRPGPGARAILQRLVDMIRDTDATTFGIGIGLAEGFLDGAQGGGADVGVMAISATFGARLGAVGDGAGHGGAGVLL
jgi:hypothetical protein